MMKSSLSFSKIAPETIHYKLWLLKIETVHTLEYILHLGCDAAENP